MAETHIDNTPAGFASHHAERSGGRPIWQRILLCFHHVLLVPIGFVITSIYIYYSFFTHPEFLSMPLIIGFILFVVGEICFAILFKMQIGWKIKILLKEIFG